MQYFIVSYDNPFMITHTLSMKCSASLMYVSSDTDWCYHNIVFFTTGTTLSPVDELRSTYNHDLSLKYFIVYVIINVYVKQI